MTDRTGAATEAADREAVPRMAAGDAAALAGLYDRHARPVFALVSRIVEDRAEAEDVVREVFSLAWSRAASFDPRRGAVGAWLLMIGRSCAIARARTRRTTPESSPGERTIPDLPDPAHGQDVAVLTEAQVGRLRQALAALPHDQRLAIEWAYFEGLSRGEIAVRLKQPPGRISAGIREGLLTLRDALA